MIDFGEASVKVLFLWWSTVFLLLMVGTHFLFPINQVLPHPETLTTGQVALIKALIHFPNSLPTYFLASPVMVGVTILCRKKWFGVI